jgi:hypothetical protein
MIAYPCLATFKVKITVLIVNKFTEKKYCLKRSPVSKMNLF